MDELHQFHFLRPWWLFLIPLWLAISVWLQKRQGRETGFEKYIAQSLLPHIRTGNSAPAAWLPYALLALIWTVASIALAGPTWKQLPQSLHQSQQAMVIVLDLSPSMRAQDNKPSRIVRARLKIQDLLKQRKDGLTALVVYSGEAHIVTPLTDDTHTINNLLATLEPGLLPIPGSNIEMAIEQAQQLVTDAGFSQANIVVFTDGIAVEAQATLKKLINSQWPLFILGVGTEQGAPIPAKNGFLTDDNNTTIVAKRDGALLKKIAQENHGYYLPLQTDDSDISFITRSASSITAAAQETERNIDQWHEFGPTLLLLVLPLLAMMFRKGWLLTLLTMSTPYWLLAPTTAEASIWDHLWLNKDQQGEKQFKQQDYNGASQHFRDYRWKGSSAYKNKDYEAALNEFSKGDTATDDYNRGNALAQLQRFDQAIAAYEQAIEKQKNFTDAQKNKTIVEKLKQKKEQEKQQESKENQEQKNQPQDNADTSPDDASKNNANHSDSNQEPEDSKEQNNDTDKQQNETKEQEADKADNKPLDEEEKNQQLDDKPKEDTKSNEKNQLAEQGTEKFSEEEQQALQQWIRKIPDDPSGLLRRKFEYEFQKRRQEYQRGDWKLPDNEAHKRY